jgi:hypothetical protein
VPICEIARDRRGLIERHAYPLLLAPDDVTGNVRAVRLKDKIETLGGVPSRGLVTSSAAPEMVMLRIKQLIVLPAKLIVPDINTGLRGIARLSMKP